MLWHYALPAHPLGSLYEEDPRLGSMTQNLITGMLVHSQAEATAKTGKQDPKRGITCWIPHQALVVLGRLSLAV